MQSHLTWLALLAWILLFLIVAIATSANWRMQRRAKWQEVLRNAHLWAASVGGTLLRVSEQPSAFDRRAKLIAQRYRVTFIDRSGAECVAVLRSTVADDVWSMEKLIRETPDEEDEDCRPPDALDRSSQGYERRHRAKNANVPVIFAPPRRRKPPRRST